MASEPTTTVTWYTRDEDHALYDKITGDIYDHYLHKIEAGKLIGQEALETEFKKNDIAFLGNEKFFGGSLYQLIEAVVADNMNIKRPPNIPDSTGARIDYQNLFIASGIDTPIAVTFAKESSKEIGALFKQLYPDKINKGEGIT